MEPIRVPSPAIGDKIASQLDIDYGVYVATCRRFQWPAASYDAWVGREYRELRSHSTQPLRSYAESRRELAVQARAELEPHARPQTKATL